MKKWIAILFCLIMMFSVALAETGTVVPNNAQPDAYDEEDGCTVFMLAADNELLTEEKKLSGMLSDDEYEIPHEGMEDFFAAFKRFLTGIGINPDEYHWHLDAIYTDGTAVLMEGYSDDCCILGALMESEDGQWMLQLSQEDSEGFDYAELHPELQPGDFLSGYVE